MNERVLAFGAIRCVVGALGATAAAQARRR
jgi:hypothetical protein